MKPGELLVDRYRIVRELGRGGAGISYLASDELAGVGESSKGRATPAAGVGESPKGGATPAAPVVVKALHLDMLEDWKAVELFEREATVLKGLHHERIPAYIDHFRQDEAGSPRFFLVRQYVEGQSLQQRVDSGWRGTEPGIQEIGAQLLRIVRHIHSLRPPIIHRDINPRNVVVRDDGEVFLLDFGGVQEAVRLSAGMGSTIVGTPGYAPLEQYIGRATVRSDLYAVAATLLFLLTHRNPAELPVRGMKIDFPSVIEISSLGLSRLLSCWLDPDEAGRTLSVEQALALLEDRAAPGDAAVVGGDTEPGAFAGSFPEDTAEEPLPSGTKITLAVEGGATHFSIPEGKMRIGTLPMGLFGIFWISFVAFWTFMAASMGAPPFFVAFSLPFWAVGIGFIIQILKSLFGRTRITIEEDRFTYTRKVLFFSKTASVPLSQVGRCRREKTGQSVSVRGALSSTVNKYQVCLEAGARELRFGSQLTDNEKKWLCRAIDSSVSKARRKTATLDSGPSAGMMQ